MNLHENHMPRFPAVKVKPSEGGRGRTTSSGLSAGDRASVDSGGMFLSEDEVILKRQASVVNEVYTGVDPEVVHHKANAK